MEGVVSMKVLVTGSDGYIGVRMVQTLRAAGHEVTGLDTGFYSKDMLYDAGFEPVQIIKKDTRDVTAQDLSGFDAVISLADLSNDPLGQHNPELTYDINFTGVLNIAKKAKEAGVPRFIYSSSCSAYGIATDDTVTEESALNPQTAYAKCKVMVEQALTGLADEAFSPVFMRNATVYGPSPRMRFDLVVNNLAGFAYVDGVIRMSSDGKPWRPLVHIQDVCDAFAAALIAPRDAVHNNVFNVGNNDGNYRIKDVAAIVKSFFPECEVTFGNSDGDTRSYKVDFTKINTQLPGYKSTRTVEDGVRELQEIFERIHMTKADFEKPSFTRLKALTTLKESGKIDDRFYWKEQA